MWQYVKHDKGVYFDLVSFFAAYSYLYRKVNATILCLTVFLKLPVIYDMNFVFWVGRVRKLWLRKITEPDPRGVHQCEDAVSWPHFLYSLCTSCLPMCSSLMPPPPSHPPTPSFRMQHPQPGPSLLRLCLLWGRRQMRRPTRQSGTTVCVVEKLSHAATFRET